MYPTCGLQRVPHYSRFREPSLKYMHILHSGTWTLSRLAFTVGDKIAKEDAHCSSLRLLHALAEQLTNRSASLPRR
jgi:hypothetical protein